MSANNANPVLAARDVNAPVGNPTEEGGKPAASAPKSLDYHRQMLQSKLSDDSKQQYISPSDNILSPCTQKLSAYKNKHFMKAKPQSLFAKTSSKNLGAATAQQEAASAGSSQTDSVASEGT